MKSHFPHHVSVYGTGLVTPQDLTTFLGKCNIPGWEFWDIDFYLAGCPHGLPGTGCRDLSSCQPVVRTPLSNEGELGAGPVSRDGA